MADRPSTWLTRALTAAAAVAALLVGVPGTAAAAGAGWGPATPLAPVAYGNGQLDVPAAWAVVGPGESTCEVGPAAPAGVVLLGAFGSSAWCPPGSAQEARPPADLVRLGPLPAGEPYRSLPKVTLDGVVLYTVVLHGRISGTVYLAPALGTELMATGPDSSRALGSIGPSARARALASGPRASPPAWARLSFAGLVLSVPRAWPVRRSAYGYDCGLQQDDAALAPPPSVVLDTDTDDLALPCPPLRAPRAAGNGLVVDQGSARFPNTVPPSAAPLRFHGLRAYVDRAQPLSVLVVYVEVPGRPMPVRLHIGLGDPLTVERILGSIRPA